MADLSMPDPRRGTAPSSEARDLRDLLGAVLDALTLDRSVANYDTRIQFRASLAKVVIRDGLDDPGWNADWLRHQLVAEEGTAEERAKNLRDPQRYGGEDQ